LRTLAKRLTDEGVPTPSAVLAARGFTVDPSPQWYATSIAKMLQHPGYMGAHAAYRNQIERGTERNPYTGKLVSIRMRSMRSEDEVYPLSPDVCPPLVTSDLFQAVQGQLARNKAEAVRNQRDPEATLLNSGYIRCGYCGGNMYSHSKYTRVRDGTRGNWIYRCRSVRPDEHGIITPCEGGYFSINAHVIDTAVWVFVRHVVEQPDHIRAAIERLKMEQEKVDSREDGQLQRAQKAHARLKRQADSFSTAIAEAPDAAVTAYTK
jgi:hypothetical protein